MFCPKCGTKNSSKSQFCVKCGRALQIEETGTQTPAATRSAGYTSAPAPSKRSPILWVILGLVGVVLIVAITWGVIALTRKTPEPATVVPPAVGETQVVVEQSAVTEAPPQPVITQAPVSPDEPITFATGYAEVPSFVTDFEVIDSLQLSHLSRVAPGALYIASPVLNTVELYDVPALELFATLQGGEAEIENVSFSPDGALLAAVDKNDTVRVWRFLDQQLLQTFQVSGIEEARGVLFIDNERVAYIGYFSRSMFVWNVNTGQLVLDLAGQLSRSGNEVVSPDGHYMAEWSNFDLGVYMLDLDTGIWLEDAYADHEHEVTCAAFTADTHMLASGSYDNTVQLWSIVENRLLLTLQHSAALQDVAFSEDGNIVYSVTSDGMVWVWDFNDVLLYKNQMAAGAAYYYLKVSPDGSVLAVETSDGKLSLFDALNGATFQELVIGSDALNQMEFSQYLDYLVVVSRAGMVTVLWFDWTNSNPPG